LATSLSLLPALLPYGWNDQPLPAGAEPARVIRHDGAHLLVVRADGVTSVRNRIDIDPAPTVGDWLALENDRVVAVLPRRSLLRRERADENGAQALAANVDIVLIACGLDRPLRPGRIDRAVTIARDAGATPVIVLTKSGAPGDTDAAAVDIPRLELQHPGVRVLVTSALEGVGLDAVLETVVGRTSVLLGESGAGKSTLVGALVGHKRVATGAVRDTDAKGRHTTTSRQLYLLPSEHGGVIIDTPGIRAVGLFTDRTAVDASFSEIQAFAAACRFGDCAHESEPGCAVRAALDDGELDRDRYDAWRHLQREVASAARRSSPHAAHEYARQFGRVAKDALKRRRD
jgi:ribosome biogenesis GTPase